MIVRHLRFAGIVVLSVLLASCHGADAPGPNTPQPVAPGYYYPQQQPPPGYYYPQQQPPPGYYYPQQQPPPAPAPSGDRFAAARQQCVTITNEYRARVGRGPLTRRTDRESCADAEAAADGRSGKAHGSFGICQQLGAQNECPSWDASSPEGSLARCLEHMFQEGPGEPYSAHGHYLNMTNTRFSGVACGFAISAQGSLWIVQDFF